MKCKPSSSIYVLENNSPSEVAEAMIKDGRQKQPFYICNVDEIYQRIVHFRKVMPRVKMFYAMKSNDTDIMLQVGAAMRTGFACSSPGEIYAIRQLDVSPKNIFFNMSKKTPEQMKYAKDIGVIHTTFDSAYELKKLKENWPEARLLIHIKVSRKNNKLEKYGCDFDDAFNLLEQAALLGMNVVGVTFHVGQERVSPDLYATGVRRARELFDYEVTAERGMEVVDIGGGFSGECTHSINEVSRVINKALEEFFPDPAVRVTGTPGTYLCESAFTLYCSISGARTITSTNGPVNMLYINDGVHGTMKLTNNTQHLSLFKRKIETETDLKETILWGPTCDSTDRVMASCKVVLPTCSTLDWLVWTNHGAYTFSYATKFSNLAIPLIQPVVSKKLWYILQETPVFDSSDFAVNPDISTPLPSTLPPILPIMQIYEHTHLPTLNV